MSNGTTFTTRISLTETVAALKEVIKERTSIENRYQKLIFNGNLLLDEQTVSDFATDEYCDIDFEMVVPSFEEVLAAMSVIEEYISDRDVNDAFSTLRTFVQCHSCCSTTITDLLISVKLRDEQYEKVKNFCETLARDNQMLKSNEQKINKDYKELSEKVERMSQKELKDVETNEQLQLKVNQLIEQYKKVNETVEKLNETAKKKSDTDLISNVQQYLDDGDIGLAFQYALSTRNSTVIKFTLVSAEYEKVFNPCQLDQSTLLSLIAFIGANMINHDELKHKFLTDAIASVNVNDKTTRTLALKITSEFYIRSQNFIVGNPHSPFIGSIKVVQMAMQSIEQNLRENE